MKTRLNLKPSAGVFQAMLGLETYIRKSSGLDSSLLQLVRMRASQINGCAYCLDMHSNNTVPDWHDVMCDSELTPMPNRSVLINTVLQRGAQTPK